MRPDILIVGQGLAGTWLAWECERAGLAFAIADRGHATATTRAGAGIINPITGRRLVKSWRIDEWRPLAREAYRELEAVLGRRLWHDMRVRRLFADEREREVAKAKLARGDLAPYVTAVPSAARAEDDEEGVWIEQAARVDFDGLLGAARARWHAQGRLREAPVEVAREMERHALVIDCSGLAGARDARWSFVPWAFSKGEMLEVAVEGLAPEVIVNRRHWVVPTSAGRAWVGATHEPGSVDSAPTAAGRAALERSARELLARPFAVLGVRAGVRVTLPDKHPLAGRHPREPRLGVLNALGAKGALWAPVLARQWVAHLVRAEIFDPEIDAGRYAGQLAGG